MAIPVALRQSPRNVSRFHEHHLVDVGLPAAWLLTRPFVDNLLLCSCCGPVTLSHKASPSSALFYGPCMPIVRVTYHPSSASFHAHLTRWVSLHSPPNVTIDRGGDGGHGQMSRTRSYLVDQTSTENTIVALQDSRRVVGASSLDPQPFAFTTVFLYVEQVRQYPPDYYSYPPACVKRDRDATSSRVTTL